MEKKRILLYFWSLFPSADCKSVAFNWRVVGGWFDSFRLHQLPTYIKYVIISFVAGKVWSLLRSHKPGASAVRICHLLPILPY